MHGSHEAGWHGDDTVLDIYLHLPTPDAGVVKVRQPLHLLSLFRGQRPTVSQSDVAPRPTITIEIPPNTARS